MKKALVTALAGLWLALTASPVLAGPLLGDSDGDGVDDLLDNCVSRPNPEQIDSDGDACGNACDADYNQDGTVGGPDFNIFRNTFGSSVGEPNYVPAVDSNADNAIGGPDFNFFRAAFGGQPGLAGPGIPIHFSTLCQQAPFP